MIFFHYDLDGFMHTEDDAWVFQGADLRKGIDQETMLRTAGWGVILLHGGGAMGVVTVYGHSDGFERGFYVDITGARKLIYTCLVKPRAWPQFYRTELLPIMEACDTAAIGAGLDRLISLIDERFPVKPPRVRPPRPPKDKPVEPPTTTPPVVTPPVVTPPEKEKDKTK